MISANVCTGKEFNKRAVEGLIKSGALDGLDLNRRENAAKSAPS